MEQFPRHLRYLQIGLEDRILPKLLMTQDTDIFNSYLKDIGANWRIIGNIQHAILKSNDDKKKEEAFRRFICTFGSYCNRDKCSYYHPFSAPPNIFSVVEPPYALKRDQRKLEIEEQAPKPEKRKISPDEPHISTPSFIAEISKEPDLKPKPEPREKTIIHPKKVKFNFEGPGWDIPVTPAVICPKCNKTHRNLSNVCT